MFQREKPPEILEDRTFFAGERKILWRAQILRYANGSVMVRLNRVGRRVVTIMFDYLELPDLVKHLSKLKINLEGSRQDEPCQQ